MAERLLTKRPDAVLIIANSVDTAMLAQQLHKRDPAVHVTASEWAATERLTELGGKAIEGMVIASFLIARARRRLTWRSATPTSSVSRWNRDSPASPVSTPPTWCSTRWRIGGRPVVERGHSCARRVCRRAVRDPVRCDGRRIARDVHDPVIRNGTFVRVH